MLDVHDPRLAHALWDHLPLGVLVVDELGVVRLINARALAMTGWSTRDEVVGRSVLEFVSDDDVGFVLDGIGRSDDFPGVVLGPFRIRYVARDGGTHWSECWAYEAPAELGFAGHVVTLSAQSVSDGLSTAMRGIAAGVEIEASLRDIAASLEGYPVVAIASILSLEREGLASTSGTWPLELPPSEGTADTPWELCARGGRDVDVATAELPAPWRQEAERHGFGAVWSRAIDVAGTRRGVLVMWRHTTVAPSPNQERHIREAVDITALTYSQHDHRARLARAAHRDHLTGAGNRARLDHAIVGGADPSGVLYIDLDGFKRVNDRLGHHAGDYVLRTVANRLDRVLGPRDQLYRVGGDEFVVLCGIAPHRVDVDAVTGLAGKIVDIIARPLLLDDGDMIDISASVGVAYNPGHFTVSVLLDHADRALLTAKRAGKRRWTAVRETAVGAADRSRA